MPRSVHADSPAGPVGLTIGVLGGSWRGRVTPWGAVVPADGSPTLDWWIAAEDRWHTPAREPTVRQRSVEGVPVVETAVRVPGGDVVQTVYAVADGGGFTVVELENRSPAGVAVALSRRDLVTSRPSATVPVEGVDAPADALVVPIGHRASVRVALAHDGRQSGARPADLPPSDAVVRGWIAQAGKGVDLRLPDVAPSVGLIALRCALLLDGPPPPDAGAAHLVAVAELGRLGTAIEGWLDDAVVVAELIGRRARRSPRLGWEDDAGLVAAREVLERVGHRRGAADVVALRDRLPGAEPTPLDPPEGALGLAWAERRVVVANALASVATVDLLSAPFPPSWAGQPVEAYGVPVGGDPAVAVGVAVRWHGERPALLWEVTGPGVALTSSGLDPAWSSDAVRGEALLTARPAPP